MVEFFESQVRPVLAENCFSCHGEKRQRGGLRLDGPAYVLKGKEDGPILVAGEPEKSRLVQAVRYQGKVKMPPKGKLPEPMIEALSTWVKLGAPWPGAKASEARGEAAQVPRDPGAIVGRGHWAFEPVRKPPLPAVKDPSWPANEVDRFILAALEEKGITPAPPADRRTLIRRVAFNLTGLPPTFEEIEAFLAESSPGALARLVDRYLASPRYGERWGRFWLDIARYADTKGYVFEEERRYPFAYTYRDYVIRAFNEDLPYDRFLEEQIAADHLELGEDRRPLAAMGFLTLGRRFLNNLPDIIDDRLDVVCRGTMALTVTCARCHDHKFDPIPTRDYYSLYGVFASSIEPRDLPLISRPADTAAYRAFEAELAKREAAVEERIRAKHAELEASIRARAGEYLAAAARDARAREEPGDKPLQLVQGELNPRVLSRWRAYLEETRKAHHPVFSPWNALADLPEADFAARAPGVIAGFADALDPERRTNRRLIAALCEAPIPSLAEAARRYGSLLAAAGSEPEPGDPAAEELRQVLHGGASPARIPAGEVERYFDRAVRSQIRDLRKKVESFKAGSPDAPPRAMVLADAPAPHRPRVFIRGNPGNQGEEVPRQFLEVLTRGRRQPFGAGSGRLELARAIASEDNPLTARVMVNRIWLYHFGAPLVSTPGDFGLRSDPPSHPELLDFLAAYFVDSGWSVKAMHRLLLLSSAFALSAREDPRHRQEDPENRLLWRANRRRLDFEAMRDGLLAAAGELELRLGGPAVEIDAPPFSRRRTVYGFIDRQNLQGLFRTFDFASPDTTSPQRFTTTVPQQALFLMNSPFVVELARKLVGRARGESGKDAVRLIRALHRRVLGREPAAGEIALGLAFAEGQADREPGEPASGLGPWESYAQALLLSNEFAFLD